MIVIMSRKKGLLLISILMISIVLLMLLAQTLYPKNVQVMNSEKNYKVYLTFDDGPSRNTEKVLDVLKAYDVKATFFVIGQTDDFRVSMYRRIISEGHSLGLHSYSHNTDKIYASLNNYIEDFEQLRDFIMELTGISPHICRMVGGSHAKYIGKALRKGIIDYYDAKGYICYDWDIDPLDSGPDALSANALAERIIHDSQKKSGQDLVILMHDDSLRKTLPDALELIIPYFMECGYAFDILREDTVLHHSKALAQ